MQRGETPVSQVLVLHSGWTGSGFSFRKSDLFYVPGMIASPRAAWLEQMNKAIEICKLPREQRAAPRAALAELQAGESLVPPVSRLPEDLLNFLDDLEVDQARVACAAVGLAVERYRRKYGRWPDGLDDLKDEFLPHLPPDPYSGRPLRYFKTEERAAVYSAGPAGRSRARPRALMVRAVIASLRRTSLGLTASGGRPG